MGTPRFTLNLRKKLSTKPPSRAIPSLKYLNDSAFRRTVFINGSALLSLTTMGNRHRNCWMPEQKFSG